MGTINGITGKEYPLCQCEIDASKVYQVTFALAKFADEKRRVSGFARGEGEHVWASANNTEEADGVVIRPRQKPSSKYCDVYISVQAPPGSMVSELPTTVKDCYSLTGDQLLAFFWFGDKPIGHIRIDWVP